MSKLHIAALKILHPQPLKLDLGSGAHPLKGFTPVDRIKLPGTIQLDLCDGDPWPFEDGYVDELHSSHFIEHIPACNIEGRYPQQEKDALLWFFDEAFRVIKPGGLFTLIWPALKSTDAFRDPTHRRFIPLEMTHYLSREGRKNMGVEHYGAVCNWVVEEARLFEGERLKPEGPWTDFERATHWDAVKAYHVVMRAEK